MKADGYDVGDKVPTSDEVLTAITTEARNVGRDAPGELQEMLDKGHAELIPAAASTRPGWTPSRPALRARGDQGLGRTGQEAP